MRARANPPGPSFVAASFVAALTRRRELAPADPEGGAHGGVAEDQVQVRASARGRRRALSRCVALLPSPRPGRTLSRKYWKRDLIACTSLSTRSPLFRLLSFAFRALAVIEIACKLCSVPNGGEDVVVFLASCTRPSAWRAEVGTLRGLASKEIGDVAAREHVLTSDWSGGAAERTSWKFKWAALMKTKNRSSVIWLSVSRNASRRVTASTRCAMRHQGLRSCWLHRGLLVEGL